MLASKIAMKTAVRSSQVSSQSGLIQPSAKSLIPFDSRLERRNRNRTDAKAAADVQILTSVQRTVSIQSAKA